MGVITDKTVKVLNDFMFYCENDHKIHSVCKQFRAGLQLMTAPYHMHTFVLFPMIKVYIDLCKRISGSLENTSEIKSCWLH